MIGAVIYYGKNTLVAELPMGTMDLQMKLSSIGVGEPADRIPLKDDEKRQLQVKLYASSPEEAHLLSLLTADRSLADANTCADLLWQAEQRALPRLKCGLLADSYRTLDEFITARESDTICEVCGAALLTASATVNGKPVAMLENSGSVNAQVPLTVVNTKGPDLPVTGDDGVWKYGVICILLMTGSTIAIILVLKGKKEPKIKR